jgi:hypothetical protein
MSISESGRLNGRKNSCGLVAWETLLGHITVPITVAKRIGQTKG